MMNALRTGVTLLLVLAAAQVSAACRWPAWDQFRKEYVSAEGRVVDPSDPRKITTSEGQSYGLFFALAANDRDAFGKLLQWTQNNLAEGDLRARLPGWLWGKKSDSEWTMLDSNSASDSDLWIAWSLLEAGRLWQMPQYVETGKALLSRIAQEEVADVPGLGPMVLPGKVALLTIRAGALTPATSRRSWRTILSATAPRGRSCAMAISACCWRRRPRASPLTGYATRKVRAGS
ncbi:Endoglucanase precursor [Raoultella terrigena]|uniref:cellulase n=1 Tax=Raoultella terrigena TaxID=577 RepID=A0A7Z8Z7F3_RAOTE|nr:Endoglucanase precursor [Raoultella terrigena]